MQTTTQTIADFLKSTNTELIICFSKYDFFKNDHHRSDIFRVTLRNKRHSFRFSFPVLNEATGTGENIPSPYEILSSLRNWEVGTFEHFCKQNGYDIDSRTAYKEYKNNMREWKNMELLFTSEELDLLQSIV